MLTGGCYCGYLRYETSGKPFHSTHCHCSICRRTTGAPFVTWFTVPKTSFQWQTGHATRFNSTPAGARCFCPVCGAQLTFESDDYPDEIDITTSSLDDPEQIPPEDHTRTSARLSWIRTNDGLPEFREDRKR